MLRLLFAVGLISAGAYGTAQFLAGSQERAAAGLSATNVTQTPSGSAQTPEPMRLSGVERIARDPSGHYRTEIKLNNFSVAGVIDTGATTIAMNETTARRAGIRLQPADYIYQVTTANGTAKAARAVIRQVSIGSIRIPEVEAVIMEDRALNTVLIGMSFMNRLRSFEYKTGNLVLHR